LESLYRKYKSRGLRILAFPANDFGRQEPGSNAEIKSFCRKKFDVTFDLFAKVSVKGDEMCDLYKFLTGKTADHEFAGDVRWNFQKYLIDPKGRIIARFGPRTSPEDQRVIEAIEEALATGD
jgi:glutathione peroxidase